MTSGAVIMCLPQWARALTEAQQVADVAAEIDTDLVRNQEAAALEPQIA